MGASRGTQGTARTLRRLAVLSLLATVCGGMSPALADEPGPAVVLASESQPVATGPGNQFDPHLSGSLLAYTSADGTASAVEYVDLATGVRGVVPNPGVRDALPDVSGHRIVFRRIDLVSPASGHPIMLFDVSAPGNGVRELAPDPGARRTSPSIGGTTVAFMQFRPGATAQTEICIADAAVPEAPATCLTDDGMINSDPAVSPDGSTVVWSKCRSTSTGCDIYVARRLADGSWGTARQLTRFPGDEFTPDTDGQIVTYSSNVAGDDDIWWSNLDGTGEHSLVLTDVPGSLEGTPRISGGAISFERDLPGSTDGDLYLFRPATGELFRLTDGGTDHEQHALSVAADGELRVAWAQPDGLVVAQNDVHALRGQLGSPTAPEYRTCLRYDPTKAHRAGSTVPLRVQLCDASGANLSAPTTTLTAVGLIKLDGSAATAYAEDSGNANPDRIFRYDLDLGGYAYNLSTKGLTRGTWALRFVVDGSPTVHELRFDVR